MRAKIRKNLYNGKLGQGGSLPGPEDITRVQLSNGIVVLSRSNFNSPSVVISGYLSTGSLLDSQEKLGMADFNASALMRGTENRNFQSIYDDLESVGASLGIDGGTHTTGFSGKALVEDLDLVLGLFAEVLQKPIFPVEQVERLRTQLLTGLSIRAQDTADMASLTFDQIVYTNHPYRHPEDGYPETIQAITREDLVEFHHKTYGPKGMVITVVGAIDPIQAVEKITHVFGDWSNTHQIDLPHLPPLIPLKGVKKQKVNISGKSQADIIIGVAGPPRCSPEYLPASIGNSILGQFGMMGRIGKVVRDKAGLAYYAYSSITGGIGPGPWTISAGVAPENVNKAVGLIRQEIGRYVTELVEEEELSDNQANFIGRLPLSLESNGGVAGALTMLERYDLGLDYYQRYESLVNSVTREDVISAAKMYLDPDNLAIAVAGPQ